jgi:isopentenyl-diphosphate delta-isomerase
MQDMMTRVDENDQVLGPITKLDGHLLSYGSAEKGKTELHRAFSLLLFNSKNELLLQQRASKKITFPSRWTNTCCSHNSHVPHELEPEPHFIGMRRAGVRRTKFELGIDDLDIDELKVVSRILYYAQSCDRFAEHELDYILFARKDIDPSFIVNPDEIDATAWVSYYDFKDFLAEQQKKADLHVPKASSNELDNSVITPWFNILIQ